MPNYNCSSVLPQIGMANFCRCGVNLYPVAPSGEVQSGLQGNPASWTQSQKLQLRNACCNATCDAFCASQPAACQAGGLPLMSDGPLTGSDSLIKKPRTRPPMRGASGMRSAIGDDRKPCNCRLISTTESGATMVTYGKKVCNNDPNKCCGNCKDPFELDPSNAMKKATGSRVSTYWGGLKIK